MTRPTEPVPTEPAAEPEGARRAMPLPVGFRVELDPAAKELEPGLWFAGGRILRLTASGRDAWPRLRRDGVTDALAGRLARRLTDGAVAHPVPPPARNPAVTVVIPVHNRAAALDRCLTALGSAHPVVVVDDASADELGTRAVAHRHGARLIRLAANVGPGAARNAGLAAVDTEFVALLDSDTVPNEGWIAALAAHLADPAVAAVAPRVVPLRASPHGSPLDLGDRRASVTPYGAVSYVPSAALVLRRAAVGTFDPALRTGEDVDLVWRLLERGWRVRYEPGVQVAHEEPAGGARLGRRHGYGRAAAPLALRHPDAVAPLMIAPWYAASAAALTARRPVLAAAAFAGAAITTGRNLRRHDVPTRGLLPAVARGVAQTWLGTGRCLAQFAAPLALVPGLRRYVAPLVVGPSLVAWWPHRHEIDPLRFVVPHLAGEIAYGSGVLAGCAQHRTIRPLRPKIVRRSP